jgi:hypothetical protein
MSVQHVEEMTRQATISDNCSLLSAMLDKLKIEVDETKLSFDSAGDIYGYMLNQPFSHFSIEYLWDIRSPYCQRKRVVFNINTVQPRKPPPDLIQAYPHFIYGCRLEMVPPDLPPDDHAPNVPALFIMTILKESPDELKTMIEFQYQVLHEGFLVKDVIRLLSGRTSLIPTDRLPNRDRLPDPDALQASTKGDLLRFQFVKAEDPFGGDIKAAAGMRDFM